MAGNHILFLISGATGLSVTHADMPRLDAVAAPRRSVLNRLVGFVTGRVATA
jgi:type IV secretory pathway VirB2 component (pilin)